MATTSTVETQMKKKTIERKDLHGLNPAAWAAANRVTHGEYSDSNKTWCGIKIIERGIKSFPPSTPRYSRVTCKACLEAANK